MKQMPDDGFYRAETSCLKTFHCKVVFDSALNNKYWFDSTTEK